MSFVAHHHIVDGNLTTHGQQARLEDDHLSLWHLDEMSEAPGQSVARIVEQGIDAVSYTHLTLPTKA